MSDTRKIFILCFTSDSGITHYSISLARKLSAHAQVVMVVGKDYWKQGYPPVEFEVLPFFNRSRWYPFDLMRLTWLLAMEQPQVVLFQSVLKSAGVEMFFIRLFGLMGIRTAITIHDVLPHYPMPWNRWMRASLYRAFDRVIVHSHRSRDDVREMGVHRPMLVVPHGLYDLFITRPPLREATREKLTLFASDHFVLLFFGTIDMRKGIGLFLQLRQVLSADEGYRFAIAGRNSIGNGQAELHAALEDARTSSDCIVHDHNIPFTEVQDYFALADAVVLPYQEGTTSGVLKLALTFGKPIIATDVGDLGETLRDGVGVLLPATCTATELAAAVREIRQNYDRCAAASVAAQELYGWEKIGQKYAHFLLDSIPVKTTAGRNG